MTALKDKVVFYLPSKDAAGEDLPEAATFPAFVNWIEPFTKKAGGGTETMGVGAWYDANGGHAESVKIYTIFCDLEKIGGFEEVEVVARGIKQDLEQASVAFEVSGVLYLV